MYYFFTESMVGGSLVQVLPGCVSVIFPVLLPHNCALEQDLWPAWLQWICSLFVAVVRIHLRLRDVTVKDLCLNKVLFSIHSFIFFKLSLFWWLIMTFSYMCVWILTGHRREQRNQHPGSVSNKERYAHARTYLISAIVTIKLWHHLIGILCGHWGREMVCLLTDWPRGARALIEWLRSPRGP